MKVERGNNGTLLEKKSNRKPEESAVGNYV